MSLGLSKSFDGAAVSDNDREMLDSSRHSKRYGASVYDRRKSGGHHTFAVKKKERKNRGKLVRRPTTPVEDLSNGVVSDADRSRDISLYQAEENDDSMLTASFSSYDDQDHFLPAPALADWAISSCSSTAETSNTSVVEASRMRLEIVQKQQSGRARKFLNERSHDNVTTDKEEETPETSFTVTTVPAVNDRTATTTEDDDDDDADADNHSGLTNPAAGNCFHHHRQQPLMSTDLSPIHKRSNVEDCTTRTPETLPCTPPPSSSDGKTRSSINFARELNLPIADADDGDSVLAWKPVWLQKQTSPLTVDSHPIPPPETDYQDDVTARMSRDNSLTISNVSNDKMSVEAFRDDTNNTSWTSERQGEDNCKCLLGVPILHQDDQDSVATVLSVESKRQCWFRNELTNAKSEWEYYRNWLDDTQRQVTQMEMLITSSHAGFSQYAQHMADVTNSPTATDTYTTNAAVVASLSRRHRAKLRSLQSRETAIRSPLCTTYRNIQEMLEPHVTAILVCARNATVLKEHITREANDLSERGKGIHCLDETIPKAEAKVQDVFAILMDILNEHEDSCGVRDGRGKSDRWLAQASYWGAARHRFAAWKTVRRQQQAVFVEIIRLDMDHKRRQHEILHEFLPLRHEMLVWTRKAYERGVDLLHDTARTIPISHNGLELADCTGEMSIADNAYVQEYRIMDVKMTTGWQSAMVVVTQDDRLHVFANYQSGVAMSMKQSIVEHLLDNHPYLSIFPGHYEVSRNGLEIELLRPGRSQLFRKRHDFVVFRLPNETEATHWFEHLHELTECRIHC
jgi:hypothetical protein